MDALPPRNPDDAHGGTAPIDALDRFDEAFYLRTHPDVAAAVGMGVWHSGLMHYGAVGHAKGRAAAPKVDAAWYGATYPMAARDIAGGRARDMEDHFHRLGRHRGYLAAPGMQRPDDAARTRSRFGGLWTDHANALDVVEGRAELGMITPAQAALLRHWIAYGYVVLPKAIPDNILAAALMDLDRAYHGQFRDMKYAVHGVGQKVAWVEEALTSPAKALDLHWFSEATRNLIFAPAILEFLHLVFERRVLASQTLGFWRGSQQTAHQDSAYVNYSLPMQFAASWIALEDVHEGAGELFYRPGSHRMADYIFAQKFKGVEEAKRLGAKAETIDGQIKEHIDRIGMQADGLGLKTGRLMARKGDVLIWAADLAHGGSPISDESTRKSMVTHYCPADCAPSYFERTKPRNAEQSVSVRQHGGGSFYSTTHYTG